MGSRQGIAAIGLVLLAGGCASGPEACGGRQAGGWFSGWGTSGATAFTLGLRRVWGACPGRDAATLGPPPSADPAGQWPASPPGPTPR